MDTTAKRKLLPVGLGASGILFILLILLIVVVMVVSSAGGGGRGSISLEGLPEILTEEMIMGAMDSEEK